MLRQSFDTWINIKKHDYWVVCWQFIWVCEKLPVHLAEWLCCCVFPSTVNRSSCRSASLPALDVSVPNCGHCNGRAGGPRRCFSLHFQDGVIWSLFSCLYFHQCVFFGEELNFKVFGSFFLSGCLFSYFGVLGVLCVLDSITTFNQAWLCRYFLQAVVCFHSLDRVFCGEERSPTPPLVVRVLSLLEPFPNPSSARCSPGLSARSLVALHSASRSVIRFELSVMKNVCV